MKLGFATFVIALTALALPAAAQDDVSAPAMEMATPSISETSAAQSEWYRQFAQAKPASSRTDLSPLPREEMQAGATFKITPRFSVGGEVSVGTDELNDTSTWESREVEAGIRLKSAFKF